MKKNMPYPPEEQRRGNPGQGRAMDRREQRYADPRVSRERHAERRDPRPERRQYPNQEYPSFAPAPHASRKRSSFLLPLLIVLLVIGLAAGGFFLYRNRSVNMKAGKNQDTYALWESTNRYRRAGTQAQNAALSMYKGLSGFFDLFIGTDQMSFYKEGPENRFISNKTDFGNQELTWAGIMDNFMNIGLISGWLPEPPPPLGRLVIPSIGVHGRLSTAEDYHSLDSAVIIGFGIVNYGEDNMPDLGEEGQVNILGHRITNRTHGFYYLEEMKTGDSFYIDDYRKGQRLYYRVEKTDRLDGEQLAESYAASPPPGYDPSISPLEYELYIKTYNVEFQDGQAVKGKPPVDGSSVMLIVCDPLIYRSHDSRLLVYGKVTETAPIPADDPAYSRYQAENGAAAAETGEVVEGE